jgi:hypothetical protein
VETGFASGRAQIIESARDLGSRASTIGNKWKPVLRPVVRQIIESARDLAAPGGASAG